MAGFLAASLLSLPFGKRAFYLVFSARIVVMEHALIPGLLTLYTLLWDLRTISIQYDLY